MPLIRVLIREQTKEQEQIARADTVARQMRLRGAGLTEDTFAIGEHRIVVT